MGDEMRVVSIYEGFFSGGARALHTNVVVGLHEAGRQRHRVLSIHREMRREATLQRMETDRCYRSLTAAGVPVASLGRRAADPTIGPLPFTASELASAARHLQRADLVLSLKEQPLRLVNHGGLPQRPVVVCLHRSDPENQGRALADLRAAVAADRVAAAICCAESTRHAYRAAGIPARLLHVIPNGVDLARFRPAPASQRSRLRRSLGLPAAASVVVFAARYDPMKNVSLFLRAARSYLEREPAGHVLMCGAGMTMANALLCGDLEAVFADDPRLLRRVHLLGIRHDMPAIYAASDVVALTSSFGEAAPLCLIEGQMCGAVPVATDVGDSADIVTGHGLITPADPEAISAAWTEAVGRRPEVLRTLARRRARFSSTRMIAAYSTLIDHVHRTVATAAR